MDGICSTHGIKRIPGVTAPLGKDNTKMNLTVTVCEDRKLIELIGGDEF